ncbi:MAG: SDR family oxidoreductase, partial [Gammaproteobacteria bacterium]|nr:SDR family oxidoreductase [Gammaproteobacteria bacterium]
MVEAIPAEATHLIMLPGLNPQTDSLEAEQVLIDLFAQLRSCAQTMQDRGELLITVQDSGGSFSPADPKQAWLSGLAAFAKTAAREWPQLEARAIDLECGDRDAEDLAEALFQELVFGGTELEVGLNAVGERVVLDAVPEKVSAGQTPFCDHDVLVISGGARGVTADCLAALAERQPLRFVLLGRSELPEEDPTTVHLPDKQALQQYFIAQNEKKATPAAINRRVSLILAGREIRYNLGRLKALGSEAHYLSADVGDHESVAAALEGVRRDWGKIHGVIHAAGVLRDKSIVNMTAEQFEVVFRTKAGGLDALLRATAQDDLKLLCCFSSLAARVGNPGQLNYNAANETLNRVCAAEKVLRPDAVIKSIGWGAWDGGMVTPVLKRHFEQLGMELIEPEAGADAFVEELYAGPESAVEVLLTGDPGREFSLRQTRPSRKAAVWFHERNFPFLHDHVIMDVPVAAMFFIIELAARFARGVSGESVVRAVRAVKVYKGIQLPNFSAQGHWVRMTAT